MVHQSKIGERNGSSESAPKALARDVGAFAHDVLTLAELQAQLFVADLRECGRRVPVPGLFLFCGLALGLACFPIVLVALALWIIQLFETTYAAGFLIAAGAGAALSVVLSVIGWFQLHKSLTVLRHSKQELVRNLRWIKKVLERNRITRTVGNDNSWRTMT